MRYKFLAPSVAIIGRYRPRIFEAKRLGMHLVKFGASVGLVPAGITAWTGADWFDNGLGAEVRGPDAALQGRSDWHRDNGSAVREDSALLVWSNREQTEIKAADGGVIAPTPGDILLVHNFHVYHRRPKHCSSDRYFFRQNVKAPDWLATKILLDNSRAL